MKKISLVILILVISFVLFADGLNKDAQLLKDEAPDVYEVVKQRAISEWEDDHTMILYTINNQSKAMYESITLSESYELIVKTQIMEWCDDDIFKYEDALLAPVDWVMVLYVSKLQIKAQANY